MAKLQAAIQDPDHWPTGTHTRPMWAHGRVYSYEATVNQGAVLGYAKTRREAQALVREYLAGECERWLAARDHA
jgi:hypothetical protein